jgi:hypothetical protein
LSRRICRETDLEGFAFPQILQLTHHPTKSSTTTFVLQPQIFQLHQAALNSAGKEFFGAKLPKSLITLETFPPRPFIMGSTGSNPTYTSPPQRAVFKGLLFDMDGTIIDSTAAVEKHWHTYDLKFLQPRYAV